jgi:hypothetical protein
MNRFTKSHITAPKVSDTRRARVGVEYSARRFCSRNKMIGSIT